ncbi:MAG: hypothetical protein J3Q66DRAFT_431263 [Benniella sp.]|nr:MAG: hypothetical protein J3Q66DRAFT_431263 [Benniella sp.]
MTHSTFVFAGTTAFEKIDYDNVDGHSVIYWEDIEAGLSRREACQVQRRYCEAFERLESQQCHPGVVLEAVLSSSGADISTAAGRNRDAASDSKVEGVVKSLQMAQVSEDTFSVDDRPYTPSRGSTHPYTNRACCTTNVSEPLVQVIKDGAARLHELSVNVSEIRDTTAVILESVSMNNKLMSENNQLAFENKNQLAEITLLQQDLASKQDEMKELQLKALDRLAQLQNGVQALLTQTYELLEYPIPRLFIVLPDERSWNPLDVCSNKFRLYFLCERGEHTKANKSNIPHRIHLAKHEGYDIGRPNEFFQQYGSYVLTILKMLKFGISAADVAVPALSNLIPDALDQATESLKLLTKTIEPGMGQVIRHIEKVSADEGEVVDRSSEQTENNEALEGADLRQLETFLKNKNKDRVLGNLYRTVTTEGHTIGRVEVALHSKVTAEQFYAALEKSRSVYELKIELGWETSQSDFKKVRDTLALTNVGPQNFSRRSSLLTRDYDFPDLRYLDISLYELKDDLSSATYLIRKATNLSSLALGTGPLGYDNGYVLEVYDEPAERRTYPITFKEWDLCIPPPPPSRESDLTMDTLQLMEYLLKACCANHNQFLYADKLNDLTAETLPKQRIVARPGLHWIELHTRKDAGRVRMLEWIQWKYIHRLEIYLEPGTLETSVMRTLVAGVKKMSGKVRLEVFSLYSDTGGLLVLTQEYLLKAFVASTTLRRLKLQATMPLEQILSLFTLANLSRLTHLTLWTKGFDSTQVDAILNGLRHATELKEFHLLGVNITFEQQTQMEARGVTLREPSMEEMQTFRLPGTTAVKKIPCDQVDGQSVIYWEDIEHFFAGVKHVMNGEAFVKLLRDSNRNRVVPHCIEHHPGVVLDIVLSSSDENTSTASGRDRDAASASMEDDVIGSLQITQLSEDTPSGDDRPYTPSKVSTLPPTTALFGFERRSRTSMTIKQIVTLAGKETIESKVEQQLVSSLPLDLQVQIRASTNVRESLIQAVKNGQVQQPSEQLIACLQELSGNVMEIKAMASMILDLISKNYKLTSENRDQLTIITQLQKELASRQDEIRQLQIQALDRLALLQKGVQALLTQTYELHEYPIPRLFIVLPQDTSSWNPLDLLSNKFRLYFLCECGEHTKSANNRIPHHIHLAKHKGYNIARPNEFFQRYGSYVLTILQMLKYGITVAGVTIPALSHLISPDAMGQVSGGLKSLTNTLEPGMNQVIDYIDQVVVGSPKQMDNNEGLEGADLRQLESFLKNNDDNRVLGNLYRTVTTEGHVKWVCIDHYRENYQEKAVGAFRNAVDALGGGFDENIGRVEVKLHSKVQAEQFYQTLESARSVYELKLDLDWNTTQDDFKRLRNALSKTSVGVLELDLGDWDGLISDRLNRNQRYDHILDIMRHPSIQSFAIRGPRNLSRRSSLLSRNYDFSNLRHLDISLHQWKDDTSGVKCLIAKSPNLSSLVLGSNTGYADGSLRLTFGDLILPPTLRHLDIPLYEWKDDISSVTYLISKASNLSRLVFGTGPLGNDNRYVLEAYNLIKDHRTYAIDFKDWNFYIPPAPKDSSQSMATHHRMEHLLKVCCESRGDTLDMDELDESTVDVFAKATTNGSSFKEISLKRDGLLGNTFIDNTSSIVAQSELHYLKIYTREEGGRVRILESIQWKNLRVLRVFLKPGTFETGVMRILVNGVSKMAGRVELDGFWFWSETDIPLTLPQEDLLQVFVASTSIGRVELKVDMTLEQMLSFSRSVDVSRLHHLELWAKDFDSAKVDSILDGLQHATKLSNLFILGANITEEQKSRMNANGVSLSGYYS